MKEGSRRTIGDNRRKECVHHSFVSKIVESYVDEKKKRRGGGGVKQYDEV